MGYFFIEDLEATLSDEGLSKPDVKFVISLLRITDDLNVYELRLGDINKIEEHNLLDQFMTACHKLGIYEDSLANEENNKDDVILRFKYKEH